MKASNITKEAKRDLIIHLKTNKQDSWKQVKILSRAGKVGKSKSEKYKNHWDVSDKQGNIKLIDFENNVYEWEEIKSDYDDETTQLPSQSINHLSKSLSDLQISERGCDANSTDEILVNQTYVTQVKPQHLECQGKRASKLEIRKGIWWNWEQWPTHNISMLGS